MTHPLDLPAPRLAGKIREGSVSAEAVVTESLRRAKAIQPRLNPFVLLREEKALEAARDVDDKKGDGHRDDRPLLGVPFAAKDLTPTAGDLTTLGSWTEGDHIATETALCILRLEEAGAILGSAGHGPAAGGFAEALVADRDSAYVCVTGGFLPEVSMRTLSLALAAALTLAGAAARADDEKPAQPCFSIRDWNGWHASKTEKDVLYVKVRMHDVWRVQLTGPEPFLDAPNMHLVSVTRGPDMVCNRLDLDLKLADNGPGGFATPLIVKDLRKLTPDEIKALPKEDQP